METIILLAVLGVVVWPVCWAIVACNRRENERMIATNSFVQETQRHLATLKHDMETKLLLGERKDV